MKDNKSPARCSNQYALKETSHTPGVWHGKNKAIDGHVTNVELKSYKAISKSPRS